jgi:hypothetical protein
MRHPVAPRTMIRVPIDLLADNFGAVLLFVKLVVVSTIIGLAVAALIERRWRR